MEVARSMLDMLIDRGVLRTTGAAIIGLVVFGVDPNSACAQVNAEALRSTLRTNPRFLWLEGALAGRAGNTQTMTFSGSIFGGLTSEPHLFFLRASADYGEARGRTTVARWVGHARYNYRLTHWIALEGLVQVQHDRFRRIAVRDLYGAGFRFTIIDAGELEVFAGTTYLFEHEAIEGISTPVVAPRENHVWNRSSNYGGVNAKIAAFVTASAVTYVQPRWEVPSDFRVLHESFISFAITKRLSARISGSVWYDHDPPVAVRTYDAEIKNSLSVKLD